MDVLKINDDDDDDDACGNLIKPIYIGDMFHHIHFQARLDVRKVDVKMAK